MNSCKTANRNKILQSVVKAIPSLYEKSDQSRAPLIRQRSLNQIPEPIQSDPEFLEFYKRGYEIVQSCVDAFGKRWRIDDLVCLIFGANGISENSFFRVAGILQPPLSDPKHHWTLSIGILHQVAVRVTKTSRNLAQFYVLDQSNSVSKMKCFTPFSGNPDTQVWAVAHLKQDNEVILLPMCGALPY